MNTNILFATGQQNIQKIFFLIDLNLLNIYSTIKVANARSQLHLPGFVQKLPLASCD
jgi:hypothetical protein